MTDEQINQIVDAQAAGSKYCGLGAGTFYGNYAAACVRAALQATEKPAGVTQLKVKRLTPGAQLPKYATEGAACFDIHVDATVWSNDFGGPDWLGSYGVQVTDSYAVTFSTGLAIEVPEDHVMLVFSRSGHGFKEGLRLANCVGVIDSDYRGELKVRLTKDGEGASRINAGDRIAQAMILPIPKVQIIETDELSSTERGEGGFGSTGK